MDAVATVGGGVSPPDVLKEMFELEQTNQSRAK